MDQGNLEQRKYLRLAALLRQQMAKGLLMPGSPLPSIGDLCWAHHISRQTASKTLRTLEADGLVYRLPGLGYFVAATPAPGRGMEAGS
jgi:DNA-binding GntR family transcriptional regulator